jgi:hypothetical protein
LSFVSIVISIVAAIVGLMYWNWASKLDKILRGEGILAHWIYTPQLWADYTQKEYEEEYSQKKGLFILVTVIALFFGFLFWALDAEAGFAVFIVMLGLIGVVAFAWQYSLWSSYRNNKRSGVKEVYISKDAVYLNRKLYCWNAPMTRLNGVSQENVRGLDLLVFKYTTDNVRYGPTTYTTLVPIPAGEEEHAQYIMLQINQQN